MSIYRSTDVDCGNISVNKVLALTAQQLEFHPQDLSKMNRNGNMCLQSQYLVGKIDKFPREEEGGFL